MGSRWIIVAGAALGATGVALGAFGKHALAETFNAKQLEAWETAGRYQMYAALALLAVGWGSAGGRVRAPRVAAGLLLAGALLFSGCLYGWVLSGVRELNFVVPIGGLLQLAGWAALAFPARGGGDDE